MDEDHYSAYGYQYSSSQQPSQSQSWANWNFTQPPPPLPPSTVLSSSYPHSQNYSRTSYGLILTSHSVPPQNHARSHTYHRSSPQLNGSRNYYGRYPKGQSVQSNRQSSQSNQSYKRNRTDSSQSDSFSKSIQPKKKKKPLSQNVPKKDWTLEEATEAFALEKELNKKCKTSLVIKFPDFEIKKEVVAQFHPGIESVHFQQPVAPRFCYVSLQDSVNGDEVIEQLNKQPFGHGFLSAEYRKDKEEDLNVTADDIDPLTLYVGNLSQEVTKEDVLKMYPNCKRMDIGFAKKMKFTRYAFIVFRTVKESVDAFKKTHGKELYNKTLIVRFRRLHGTVGMPGESKVQNVTKTRDETNSVTNSADSSNVVASLLPDTVDTTEHSNNACNFTELTKTSETESLQSKEGSRSPNATLSKENSSIVESVDFVLNNVERINSPHREPLETGVREIKTERINPTPPEDVSSNNFDDFLRVSLSKSNFTHRPKPIKIESGVTIKEEKQDYNFDNVNCANVKTEPEETFQIKREPDDDNEEIDYRELYEGIQESEDDDENSPNDIPRIGNLYQNIIEHANKLNSLRKGGP